MKPGDVQADILPAAASDDRPPLRGARAAAAAGLAAIAAVRQAAGHDTHRRPPCQLLRDGEGRVLRDRAGRYLDPHDWRPADRPGWLVCTRCSHFMETSEPERAAARFAAKGRP